MKENNSNELHEKLFSPKKEAAEKKAFPLFFVVAVALMLVAIILLTVFLTSYFSVVHLRSDDSGVTLVDKRKDVKYVLAPMCYEPINYWTEVYATYGDTEYFRVYGADPLEYLCTTEYNIYDLYHSDEIRLPTLAQFGANYTRVCETEERSIMLRSLDKETTEGIIKYFINAETVDSSYIYDVESNLDLKFMSETYDFMYYVISYYKTESGERYLFDRSMGRCVSLGDMFKDEL